MNPVAFRSILHLVRLFVIYYIYLFSMCVCVHGCGCMSGGIHILKHEVNITGQLVGVSVSSLLLPCGAQ